MRGAAAPARERYGAGRAAAAILFALGAAGAVHLHLELFPPERFETTAPRYVRAAIAGLVAGWRVLGLGLGRGGPQAALLSLTTAGVAAVIFCAMAGLKSVVDTYAFSSFSTVMKLVDHLLMTAAGTGELMLGSPALIAAAAGALALGPVCEALHHRLDVARIPDL